MTNKKLTLKEMIDFLKGLSLNDEHDTFITVFKGDEIDKEISCTSKIKITEGKNCIRIKSELSRRYVSFATNNIEKITYEIYDSEMRFAHLKISDKKRTAVITIDLDVLENCLVYKMVS